MSKAEFRKKVLATFSEVAEPNLPADAPDSTVVPLLVTFTLGEIRQMKRSDEHWEFEAADEIAALRAAEQPASVATMQAAKSAERTFAEQPAPEKGETEALYLANRDKESILRRIDTEIAKAEADPASGEINSTLRDGRLGALRNLKSVIVEAGWITPRRPSHPADAGSGEDATTAHGIFDEVLVERLRTYPPEKAHVRTAATRILQLNRDLSAAREQIAELQSVVAYNKRMADDREALLEDCNRTLEHVERERDDAREQWRAAAKAAVTRQEAIERLTAERDAISQEVALREQQFAETVSRMADDAIAQGARAYEECAKIGLDIIAQEDAFAEADVKPDINLHALRVARYGTAKQIVERIRAASLARGE